jgi:hypothetical protein
MGFAHHLAHVSHAVGRGVVKKSAQFCLNLEYSEPI